MVIDIMTQIVKCVWNEVPKEYGIVINKNKTNQIMISGRVHEDLNITLDNTNVEQVTNEVVAPCTTYGRDKIT